MKFRSKWTILSSLCLSFIFLLVIYNRAAFPRLDNDADRYYHLAFSRQAAHNGIVRSVPQAEDIHWDKSFADKEFLFHALSAVAYKLGGDRGVMTLVPVLGIAIILSLFLILNAFVPLRSAVIASLLLITNGYYVMRVTALRPALLSTVIILWFLYALLNRKPRLLFGMGALFALSYHALYIPGVILAVFVAATFKKEKKGLTLALWGLGGIACGVLANPYFPANLSLMLQHLQVATGWGIPKDYLNFGIEVYAFTSKEWAKCFLGPTLAVLAAVIAFVHAAFRKGPNRTSAWSEELSRTLVFPLLISSIFLCLSLVTPRAGEYFLPFSALLLGFALQSLQEKPVQFWGFALLIIAGQSLTPMAVQEDEITEGNRLISSTLVALKHIPLDASGKKVFHDNWTQGPVVYYARPDLRFVDLLDPTFLLFADREKLILKDTLTAGDIPDAYYLLKSHFGANYVLTQNPILAQQLDTDPNFERIYSPPISGDPILYSVRDQRAPNQILQFDAALVQNKTIAPAPKELTWIPLGTKAEDRIPTAMMDLHRWYVDNYLQTLGPPAGNELCVAVKPTTEVIQAHLGAEFLGLGGGESVQLWWNKRLIYSFEKSPGDSAKLTDFLVPLPRPLKGQDQIVATVCATRRSRFYAISLSLWKGQELDRSGCSRKNGAISSATQNSNQYCVAPLAPAYAR